MLCSPLRSRTYSADRILAWETAAETDEISRTPRTSNIVIAVEGMGENKGAEGEEICADLAAGRGEGVHVVEVEEGGDGGHNPISS